MSQKIILNKMHNKRVIKEVHGGYCVEDTDKLKADIISALKSHGIDPDLLQDEGTVFSLKGYTNVWLKPKLKRTESGTLTVRSKDYIFKPDSRAESEKGIHGEIAHLIASNNPPMITKVIGDETKGNAQKITYRLAE